MKRVLSVSVIGLLMLAGCTAAQSLGNTTANISLKDGTVINWDNNKNINFKADFDGKNETLHFEGQSMTPEAAMANVAASNAAVAAVLSKLADQLSTLIPAAAKTSALAGS